MIKIGLLSDTHGYLDPKIYKYFNKVDEIWHAGDIGSLKVIDELKAFKPLKAVYGNIDNHEIRSIFREVEFFISNGLKVLIIHIGGYPNRYPAKIQALIEEYNPDLFICGHSHILKVIYDKRNGLMHMNPGACGRYGIHTMRTLLRFSVGDGKVSKLEVIELGRRGKIDKGEEE